MHVVVGRADAVVGTLRAFRGYHGLSCALALWLIVVGITAEGAETEGRGWTITVGIERCEFGLIGAIVIVGTVGIVASLTVSVMVQDRNSDFAMLVVVVAVVIWTATKFIVGIVEARAHTKSSSSNTSANQGDIIVP